MTAADIRLLGIGAISALVLLTMITLQWLRDRRDGRGGVLDAGPVTDHVVVLPTPPGKTAFGMDLPETQIERASEGVVVAVGPGRVTEHGVRIPPEVAVGDHVVYPPGAGVDQIMSLGARPNIYRIMRQDEIAYNHGPAGEESVTVE